jgi:cbb3-type cytochrome oxidase subunit 3
MLSGVAVTVLVVALFVAGVVVAFRPREWHATGELRRQNLREERDRRG